MGEELLKSGVIIDENGEKREFYLTEPKAILDETTNEPSGWYKQIVSLVNVVNDNVRLYPRAVYQAALDELKAQNFPYAGEHPHPVSFIGADKRVHFKTSIPHSAVKFRDAYIDEQNQVWAEYMLLDTEMGRQVKSFIDSGLPFGFSNRMTGETASRTINDAAVDVAKSLTLYAWDVVLNPAEKATLHQPQMLADDAIEQLLTEEEPKNEEDNLMDELLKMDLQQLKEWKAQNVNHEQMSLCDHLIEAAEKTAAAEAKAQALLDAKAKEEQQKAAQKALADAVAALSYDDAVKTAILERGKTIINENEVADFIANESALVDAVVVKTKLNDLGVPNDQANGKAKVIITENPKSPLDILTDSLMANFDRELAKKDHDFVIDENLRKANLAILDSTLDQMKRDNNSEYHNLMARLNEGAKNIVLKDDIVDGTIMNTTGDFAQEAAISMAMMRQVWQDLKFLQLCLVEPFNGSAYKVPVEFTSYDLFTEDIFNVSELDGIPNEGIETFFLEFGGEWLKRGFIITKEAQREMETGPYRYDVFAQNAASMISRFNRIIDRKISTEMIARSDEYMAKTVKNETPTDDDIIAIQAGVNAPEETNAAFAVKLLCGTTSPRTGNKIPPVVRPRISVYLDHKGRTNREYINDIMVKKADGTVLTRGAWIASSGKIVPLPEQGAPDYAVDFENAMIYFMPDVISKTSKPTMAQYAYATNLAWFDLTVPAALENFKARYYNGLLELIDVQKAFMGSAPRYVTPNFLLGSLNAMVPVRQAELFYTSASPAGTSLLKGQMYLAERNGITIAEHNAPWDGGDSRLLLGNRNATRVGMGSPYTLEGPFPHYTKQGSITSSRQYFATQQLAINTPLVIDEKGKQYHPPFRTIKLYNS